MSKARWGVPLLVFGVVLAHGSLFGLTDDEAYYWVLAQRPAPGYAYHPPAVALLIALSQLLFGWLAGGASAFVVRLPAAVCAAGMTALALGWVERARAGESGAAGGHGEAWLLLSLAGIFGLSWMMVPDLPLFLGWTLAFAATWELCDPGRPARARHYAMLAGGLALAVLSKFSGVLGALSAAAALFFWAPRERLARGLGAIAAGGALAAAPILYWNATHEWAAILYQIRERHGGAHLSFARYLRFWLIECVLAGPGLAWYLGSLARRWARRQAPRAERFVLAWAVPGAAVFFAQPLWSDFKPHWALIVWWPLMIGMAWAHASGRLPRRAARVQRIYGLALVAVVSVACHVPILTWLTSGFGSRAVDPKLDVTNDLYGWGELRANLAREGGEEATRLPILSARYQTASQAAFSMGVGAPVSMIPRDLKAMDEWPSLEVAEGQGPGWPKLRGPVLFVGDSRYDDEPAYPGARCARAWTFERKRMGLPAKTVFVWKCSPM